MIYLVNSMIIAPRFRSDPYAMSNIENAQLCRSCLCLRQVIAGRDLARFRPQTSRMERPSQHRVEIADIRAAYGAQLRGD